MRLRTLVLFLAAALLLVSCDSGGPSPEEAFPSEAVSWLRANAHSFDTAEPTGDFSDLEPLREMIGDARIVSLGEATHGTKEFFQMKHRILRFLVTEMGFTAFGIEATLPESFLVNEYVRDGTGDAAARLAGLYFWTWNTQEVLDMIEWMRAHNAAHPGSEVSFYGFDISMGSVLDERYGEDLFTVGFSFYAGTCNAVLWENGSVQGLQALRVPPPPENSYERYFNLVEAPRFFLDLRDADRASAGTSWITSLHQFRSIGAVYNPGEAHWYFYNSRLPTEFDAVVHFRDTSPSDLLPFPSGSSSTGLSFSQAGFPR